MILSMKQQVMKYLILLIGIMLIQVNDSMAQDLKLEEGFQLLDGGNYEEAIDFFEDKNKDFPDNKYVIQALARSYGLNKNYTAAEALCKQYLAVHEGDIELIGTNAELASWQQNPDEAIRQLMPLYEEVVSIKSLDMIYANALIAAGKLKDARRLLPYIQRNEARVVWMDLYKNLFLKLADSKRKEEDYKNAVLYLDSILMIQPMDPNALMTRGDIYMESERYSKAAITYKDMVSTGWDKSNAMINYSYALFKSKHPIQSLGVAQRAWIENQTNAYTSINYFNAMLWNGKLNEAKIFLNKNKSVIGETATQLLEARWAVASGNYQKGISIYRNLNNRVEDKNYLMEYMILLLNKNYDSELNALLFQKKDLFDKKELKEINDMLAERTQDRVGVQTDYFIDIAENEYWAKKVYWKGNLSSKLTTQVSIGSTEYKHLELDAINAYFGELNINYRFNPAWRMEAKGILYNFKPKADNSFMMNAFKVSLVNQAHDRYMFRLSGAKDFMNFTNELLLKKVLWNQVAMATNLMLSAKVGMYVESDYTKYSDKNERALVFGSLYRVLRTEPTIKVGVNTTWLHFKLPNNRYYFAPDDYKNSELFLDYTTAFANKSKFYTTIQVAMGAQSIERAKAVLTYRIQGEAGMHLRHMDLFLKYQAGNASNATNTGYSYDLATFNVCYKW